MAGLLRRSWDENLYKDMSRCSWGCIFCNDLVREMKKSVLMYWDRFLVEVLLETD